jgi:hypothetical protein
MRLLDAFQNRDNAIAEIESATKSSKSINPSRRLKVFQASVPQAGLHSGSPWGSLKTLALTIRPSKLQQFWTGKLGPDLHI